MSHAAQQLGHSGTLASRFHRSVSLNIASDIAHHIARCIQKRFSSNVEVMNDIYTFTQQFRYLNVNLVCNYSGDLNSKHFEIRKHLERSSFQILGFSHGLSPDHSKSGRFCPDFKWFLTKWWPICPDFKWLGFQISDPIQNLDHLQPNIHSKYRLVRISDSHCTQV